MMDDRRYNQRKNPSLLHKIRVIMGSKQNPMQYGVTIPKPIAQQFSGCKFMVQVSGNSVILESGCKAAAVEMHKLTWGDKAWQDYKGG